MSNVAHRSFALVPSESSFEGLTKRLLALRAEIDAILAELSSQATAMARGEAIAAPSAPELLPAPSDPLMDAKSMRGDDAVIEDAETASAEHVTEEFPEPSETVCTTAPEQPIADATALEPVEVEQETCDHAERTSDEPAVIEIDLSDRADGTSQCLEPEASRMADISAATEVVSAERPANAAILDAPQHSPIQAKEPAALVDAGTADAALAGDSPATPAAAAAKVPADAAVISLHGRQRKQKAEPAIRAPRPIRPSRHMTAKIAACILVLLTAATILVMADRTAMGSVQSLPWMAPMPSAPAATEQSLQPDQRGAAQALDEAAAMAELPPLADGILMRYRGAWPSGS